MTGMEKRIELRLSEELLSALDAKAASLAMSRSVLIRYGLATFLKFDTGARKTLDDSLGPKEALEVSDPSVPVASPPAQPTGPVPDQRAGGGKTPVAPELTAPQEPASLPTCDHKAHRKLQTLSGALVCQGCRAVTKEAV